MKFNGLSLLLVVLLTFVIVSSAGRIRQPTIQPQIHKQTGDAIVKSQEENVAHPDDDPAGQHVALKSLQLILTWVKGSKRDCWIDAQTISREIQRILESLGNGHGYIDNLERLGPPRDIGLATVNECIVCKAHEANLNLPKTTLMLYLLFDVVKSRRPWEEEMSSVLSELLKKKERSLELGWFRKLKRGLLALVRGHGQREAIEAMATFDFDLLGISLGHISKKALKSCNTLDFSFIDLGLLKIAFLGHDVTDACVYTSLAEEHELMNVEMQHESTTEFGSWLIPLMAKFGRSGFFMKKDDMDGVVDWKSAKQSIFATSSIEAKYIAAFDASKEAVFVRKFISGLGVVPTIEKPINMYCDNIRAIVIANEYGITKGARHLRAKVHYIREVIEFGDVKLKKVHTNDNLADLFTKVLAFPKHSELTRNIGMLPASSLMLHSTLLGTSNKKTSLFEILKTTRTAGGTRLLRANLLQPLKDMQTINARLDCLDELMTNEQLFFGLSQALRKFPKETDRVLYHFCFKPKKVTNQVVLGIDNGRKSQLLISSISVLKTALDAFHFSQRFLS
ncbi:retrovirus-related pol polyprotein from transposon TNT 1-94 [Tanacetum coccineum]